MMKGLIILFYCIFCIWRVSAQSVLVVRADSIPGEVSYSSGQRIHTPSFSPDSILNVSDPKLITNKALRKEMEQRYYINIHYINDTVNIIRDLINLKGDVRVSNYPITCRSSISSTFFTGTGKPISVQVYALYIIWGLFFDYKTTAAYQVLEKRVDGKRLLENFDGEIVDQAFSAYEKWFEEANGDLDKLRKTNPLKDSGIRWLF